MFLSGASPDLGVLKRRFSLVPCEASFAGEKRHRGAALQRFVLRKDSS